MVWFAFGTGVLLGLMVGALAIELITLTADYRERKKLPLDRQIWQQHCRKVT